MPHLRRRDVRHVFSRRRVYYRSRHTLLACGARQRSTPSPAGEGKSLSQDIERVIFVVQFGRGISLKAHVRLIGLDWLTLSFVALLLGAAILLTLNVRGQILRAAIAKREEQHDQEEETRRKNVPQRNPRSATRR